MCKYVYDWSIAIVHDQEECNLDELVQERREGCSDGQPASRDQASRIG